MLALECVIIDMLSQYYPHNEDGEFTPSLNVSRSSRDKFVGWAKSQMPTPFNEKLKPPGGRPITIQYRGENDKLVYFADALYIGFRCGILHEAHAAKYCINIDLPKRSVATKVAWITSEQFTVRMEGTRPRPAATVAINPLNLRTLLKTVFDSYVRDKPQGGKDDEACRSFQLGCQGSYRRTSGSSRPVPPGRVGGNSRLSAGRHRRLIRWFEPASEASAHRR